MRRLYIMECTALFCFIPVRIYCFAGHTILQEIGVFSKSTHVYTSYLLQNTAVL